MISKESLKNLGFLNFNQESDFDHRSLILLGCFGGSLTNHAKDSHVFENTFLNADVYNWFEYLFLCRAANVDYSLISSHWPSYPLTTTQNEKATKNQQNS